MSTIQLTSDTLVGSPSAGQVEYNGQFYATDSNSLRGQVQRLTQGTAVASTSGTSISFTGIPAWAKRITVILNEISTSGTSNPIIQVGAGSTTNTGYLSSSGTATASIVTSTAGMVLNSALAANIISGVMTLINVSGNTWISSHACKISSTNTNFGGGSITLSGTLDRVIMTTAGGTDTFDAGSINVMWEG